MKRKKVHYAWFILFGCALMYFTTTGLGCNNYSVYSPFIMNTYGYKKTQISLLSSAGSLASTLVVLLTTGFYRKFSLKKGLMISGAMMCTAYVIMGLADNYLMYLLGAVVKGSAYALGSMVPMSMMIERWFRTGQTMALSIISAASGMATIGVPSVITWAIGRFGLSNAFFIFAAALLVLYVISLLLLRNDPSEMGLSPYEDGRKNEEADTDENEQPVSCLPERWWIIMAITIFLGTSAVTCYTNLAMLSSTEGIRPEIAAIMISAAGVGMTAGKLLFGSAATSIGLRKASFLFGLISVAGLLLCCFVRLRGAVPFIGAGLTGTSLSALVVGSVAWAQDWARPEERADRIKAFQFMYNMGCMVFGIVAGVSADLCGGSYVPFYAASSVIAVYFLVTVQAAYRKQERLRSKSRHTQNIYR